MTDAVLYTVAEPHIALVTLNRPEARNAVNGAVAAGLEAALLSALCLSWTSRRRT